MYILRAYQSPASMADCGPQCAQMPNLASRNHAGISYLLKDARVPSKGPRSISIPGDGSCCAAPSFNAGSVPAISLQAVRLVIFIDMVFGPPSWYYSNGMLACACACNLITREEGAQLELAAPNPPISGERLGFWTT